METLNREETLREIESLKRQERIRRHVLEGYNVRYNKMGEIMRGLTAELDSLERRRLQLEASLAEIKKLPYSNGKPSRKTRKKVDALQTILSLSDKERQDLLAALQDIN